MNDDFADRANAIVEGIAAYIHDPVKAELKRAIAAALREASLVTKEPGEEVRQIVAWLRTIDRIRVNGNAFETIAHAIERGDHLRSTPLPAPMVNDPTGILGSHETMAANFKAIRAESHEALKEIAGHEPNASPPIPVGSKTPAEIWDQGYRAARYHEEASNPYR